MTSVSLADDTVTLSKCLAHDAVRLTYLVIELCPQCNMPCA